MVSFVLASKDGSLATEAVQLPFADTGTNTDVSAFQIGQTDTDFSDPAAGPIVDLGNILPPGITDEIQLSAYLALAEHASDLGHGGPLALRVLP